MVVGIDSHKETVAACVVDEPGGELASAIFPNTGAGHDSLLSWASSCGKVSLFGIEGSGGVGYALARRLATLGEGVVEVPPFLTVRERKHLRQRGKSDPADALAHCARTATPPGTLETGCRNGPLPATNVESVIAGASTVDR